MILRNVLLINIEIKRLMFQNVVKAICIIRNIFFSIVERLQWD